ncbi:probable serine/threonine-protein kinase PBL7 [Andrographis paniculata]|uniref:probable serine/threonine-protein kinase PBL7 n=1 Tax=Andrographis paniculata TaxID=175694 RepID=UPI0021E6ECCC|nr:probable serine/threonine-protein kinase PBL7 [Andrographis paniculata]
MPAINCSILPPKKHPKEATAAGGGGGLPAPRSGNIASSPPSSFSFQELSNATDNFSSQCLLRREESGSVYKGTLRGGELVAIKKLDGNVRQSNMRLLVEVLILNCLTHPNIVKMIGYCSDSDRRLLVYEYLPAGLLPDRLHDPSPGQNLLDWAARMKIAAGAAKALEYLHNKAKPQVIFRDFKTSSVLLDNGDWPKLYNFGLSKICSIKNEPHRVVGTQGYCAPEQAEPGQLSIKSDLYSFGVVLLELITGRKAIDTSKPEGEQKLVQWARKYLDDGKNLEQIADPRMEGKFPRRGLYQALMVASLCIRDDPNGRPLISNVATALSYLVTQSNFPDDDGGGGDKNVESSLNVG